MRRTTALLSALGLMGGAVLTASFALVGLEPNTVNDNLLTFTPATVVDPVLFGGEPGINVDPSKKDSSRLFVDWPVGSTQNIGVLFRSEDGGLSFTKRYAEAASTTEAGVACQARQVPFCLAGGGGDTDVNLDAKTGRVYMGNQEALANQAVGVSSDHGTTFPADHVDAAVAKTTAVDRQWLASWKGTDTVFLAYHVPAVGEFINRSDAGGATGSWSIPATPQVPWVTQSGSFVADNTGGIHNHALYLGYLDFGDPTGQAADLGGGFAVSVSTDGAKTFQSHPVPGAVNARNFTVLGLDNVGNLYASWVDNKTNATFFSSSKADAGVNKTAPGTLWSKPVQVSAKPVKLSIFSNLVAGSPGRVAIGYYGTTAKAATPDAVKPGAGGWFPYVATSYNALCQWDKKKPCTQPKFHQSRIAAQANQDDNICTAGTTCAATMGNRNLADYFDISLDRQGHLAFVWSDGNNATKKPFVKVSRQATGPSLYAGMPDAHLSKRGNGYADAAGDARYPIAGASIKAATNKPTLDLRGTTVKRKGSNLEVTIKLTSTSNLAGEISPTTVDGLSPLAQAKWVTRWDYKGHAYYVGAKVATGGQATPTYFAGEVNEAQGLRGAGTGLYYGNRYTAQLPATGKVKGKSLVITVPAASVGASKKGARLLSVGTYSLVGNTDDLLTILSAPITVDSSPTFNVTL